jgi:indolepyruvate ferredoxin oxidoreductase
MTKSATTLDDKYLKPTGRVFLSSNQALTRLPLEQARRDRAAGLKTAGYISGYRGSPLGVYDSSLWAAQKLLDSHAIRFVPGLNEELAVSAIRGTQEIDWFGRSGLDGVFGLWYGKGIGVDRACESLKLGNLEGTAVKGGFLAVAGDDHGGKSSDSAHQSEQTLIAAFLPILYPATIGEILEFGLFGWAMSRYSGCYVALKCITDTLDLTASVELPDIPLAYAIPTDIQLPPGGLNLRQNQPPLVEEDRLVNWRLPAATAFGRANGIDRTVIDGERRTLSIVSAGKAYLDTRQALSDLGLDDAACRRLGIRLYKPGLIWPMDKDRLTDFAAGSTARITILSAARPHFAHWRLAQRPSALRTSGRRTFARVVPTIRALRFPTAPSRSAASAVTGWSRWSWTAIRCSSCPWVMKARTGHRSDRSWTRRMYSQTWAMGLIRTRASLPFEPPWLPRQISPTSCYITMPWP